MKEAVRINQLSPALVENAINSWTDQSSPGLDNYYREYLPQCVDIIVAGLRKKGYYPNPTYWYYSNNCGRVDVPIGEYIYTVEVPNVWYCGLEQSGKAIFENSKLNQELRNSWVYVLLPSSGVREGRLAAGTVDDSLNIQVNDAMQYFVGKIVSDFIAANPPDIYSIDRSGSYSYLLFWNDTGEMLSEFEGEEWWCDHSFDEIKEMFADNVSVKVE